MRGISCDGQHILGLWSANSWISKGVVSGRNGAVGTAGGVVPPTGLTATTRSSTQDADNLASAS